MKKTTTTHKPSKQDYFDYNTLFAASTWKNDNHCGAIKAVGFLVNSKL